MQKCENNIECQLIKGTTIDFNGICNQVREFTPDTFAFVCKNFDTSLEIILEVIPKNQIKRIIFNHSEDDVKKVLTKENK